MKKLILGPLTAAAVLGASMMSGAVVAQTSMEETPKPKRKPTRKKKRAKAAPSYFTTRGKYIPAGEYRNCGERGISPKLMERRNG